MFPINDPHSHLGIITYRNTKLCIHLHLLLSNYSPSASSSSRLMVQPKAVSSDAPREADSHHHPSLLSAVLKPPTLLIPNSSSPFSSMLPLALDAFLDSALDSAPINLLFSSPFRKPCLTLHFRNHSPCPLE